MAEGGGWLLDEVEGGGVGMEVMVGEERRVRLGGWVGSSAECCGDSVCSSLFAMIADGGGKWD